MKDIPLATTIGEAFSGVSRPRKIKQLEGIMSDISFNLTSLKRKINYFYLSEEVKMKLPELTYEEVNEAIAYNPDTGDFIWKKDVSNNVKAGSVAGSLKNCRHRSTGQIKSYLYIRYEGREMVASRVALLLSNGEWPAQSVQFVDGNTTNLKISNLKLSKFKSAVVSVDGRRSYKMSKDAQRHYGLKRYYGISVADYAEMYRSQDGKCSICHQPELGKDRHGNIRVLAVDHCHKTGKIRELLCYACNSMLGQARDNKQTLLAAIAYLDKHEASDNLGNPSPQTGLADVCTDYGDNPCAER